MRELDGVTRQRLENQVVQATIANERPSGEVLSQTLASPDVAQQASDFQGRLAQVVRSHDTLVAQLNQAVQALDRAKQNFAAAATAAAHHLAQQEADLAAAKSETATLRESLERQLANASDRAADAEVAAERLTRRETELAKAVAAHQNLERRFSAAVTLLQEQDADLEATTKRLTKREAELAEAAETRLSLERQLAEAESALGEAVRRSADDRSTAIEQAAQRQSEFQAGLRAEVAKSDTLAQDLLATRQELAHADTMLREGTAARQMLEGQLAGAHTARQSAEQRAAAERLADRQQAAERDREFVARLDQEVATRQTLEQALTVAGNKVAEAETAIRDAEHRHASHVTTVTARFADQQVQYETRLAEAAAARDLLDQRLREVEVSFERSLEAQRVEALANLQMLEGQLAGAHTALQAAEQRAAAERLTARQQAAERDAEFVARFDQEAATRETLEQALTVARNKVAETETAIRDAEHRHASHMTTVTARFADQQVQYEARIAEAAAVRDLVDQRLREVEVSFERSREERAADAAAAAERLARLEAQRVEALANRQKLEGQLANANAARHVAEECVATEHLTAERQAAQRQAEFEAQIARETAGRQAVEQDLATSQQKLAESESALRNAEQRHASEMMTAAGHFAARQRDSETLLAQTTAVKDASDLRLREAEATLERIRDERRAEAIAVAEQRTQLESALAKATELVVSERVASAERATERQMEFDARLSLELGTRNTIEQALAATRQDLLQTEAALRDATAQHTKAMTSASNELSEQHSQYTTQLAQASAAHAALEQKLADADQRHTSALSAAATQLTAQQREYETRLAEATTAREIVSQQLHDTETTLLRTQQESDASAIASAERLSQRESELAAASAARQLLEGRLVDTETALEHAEARALAERTAAIQQSAQRRAEFDAQLAREVEARNVVERDLAENRMAAARERADYEGKLADANENFERIRQAKEVEREALRQSLDQVRADALQTLERVGSEHTAELVRINALVAERDGRIKDQAARHALSQEAAQQALAKLETESRRQFDESPISILRCSDAGVLKEVNRALVTALGYRTVDQLRALGSAASVFESPDDFRWLIDHCEPTPSESVDCIWKKKDGSRLTMRLRAIRLSADVVDIVAEDVTTLRAVEERLRRAQRMEAVGRLASEVADTCDILLRNVSQDGQQWLATVGSNTAQRHQGELILGDVTRAANFLRQLSVYGEKQTGALAAVDVNTVLRDLAPVLKRVAGDDIELVLPKKVVALNVDVDAERVERVLVNIAAYGRARMPSGGRLIVELARVVVDLDFVTKYPNVRHGAHALISVTEVRTAAPAEWPMGTREAVEGTAIGATSERPGVDLGALQALIGDCGGHLWMKAEPGGDMELKIHLPLRSADTSRSAGVVRSAIGRSVSTWFQT